MEVYIQKSFTDQLTGGKLYGRGKHDLKEPLAARFIAENRAVPAGQAKVAQAETETSTSTIETDGPDGVVVVQSDLPEGFPAREKLIAAGLGTIELLSHPDARDKIAAVKGIGPTKVSEIGVALSELMADSL